MNVLPRTRLLKTTGRGVLGKEGGEGGGGRLGVIKGGGSDVQEATKEFLGAKKMRKTHTLMEEEMVMVRVKCVSVLVNKGRVSVE